MAQSAADLGTEPIAFEAFGVRMLVSANSPEALQRLSALLPPGWEPVPWRQANHRPGLIADPSSEITPVDALGGIAGEEPLPVGAVVVTTYRLGAEWRPQPFSPGKAVLALLENTVPARTRTAEALRAMTRATRGAVVIESDRGEADALAPRLLSELEH